MAFELDPVGHTAIKPLPSNNLFHRFGGDNQRHDENPLPMLPKNGLFIVL